jgi:hypothetical protein
VGRALALGSVPFSTSRLPAALLAVALLIAGCGGGGGGGPGGDDGGTPALGQDGGESGAAGALGFPAFATKNTTRVGGADPVADAAGVARAVYPARSRDTRPPAVTLVDRDDWRTAISAAQLMADPIRAPVLFSEGDELPEATDAALEALGPPGAPQAGGAQVLRMGAAPAPDGLKATDVKGAGFAALARGIDRLATSAAGTPSEGVIVAPADAPAFAMPAAGWAAKSGDPVLWAGRDSLPPDTRAAIESHQRPRIYVLGPPSAISENVERELSRLGRTTRIEGRDPVENAIAFARFSDGRFGWNVVDPGHGLVFASTGRTAEAAAAAPLSASGTYGPLLLLPDANTLPESLQNYLLDIQPGYRTDPVRGVYNHGWLMGDEQAISLDVQARIDTLLEIQAVDEER